MIINHYNNDVEIKKGLSPSQERLEIFNAIETFFIGFGFASTFTPTNLPTKKSAPKSEPKAIDSTQNQAKIEKSLLDEIANDEKNKQEALQKKKLRQQETKQAKAKEDERKKEEKSQREKERASQEAAKKEAEKTAALQKAAERETRRNERDKAIFLEMQTKQTEVSEDNTAAALPNEASTELQKLMPRASSTPVYSTNNLPSFFNESRPHPSVTTPPPTDEESEFFIPSPVKNWADMLPDAFK